MTFQLFSIRTMKHAAVVAAMSLSAHAGATTPPNANTAGQAKSTAHPSTSAKANTALVQQAFDNWKAGTGTVFDLLSDDAVWTVAGVSPVSGTYDNRQALIDGAVRPIHDMLSTPITPEVKHIVAQGDNVVVLWDGTATAKDGSIYNNSYAWHLVMQQDQITQVTAFLDTWNLVELMQ